MQKSTIRQKWDVEKTAPTKHTGYIDSQLGHTEGCPQLSVLGEKLIMSTNILTGHILHFPCSGTSSLSKDIGSKANAITFVSPNYYAWPCLTFCCETPFYSRQVLWQPYPVLFWNLKQYLNTYWLNPTRQPTTQATISLSHSSTNKLQLASHCVPHCVLSL